ncbi:MAG: MBL fold metallo-hydrolase [Ignavibacteria bacterium]|nr:MBL fold metallo-hydrolase [Ignavibacteria bacterium]
MKIGEYTIECINTGAFGLDGGAMFGVVPKNLWSKAYNPGDEQNRIPMAARCLLLSSKDKKILVDTGCGTKLSEKLQKIYKLDNSEQTLLNSLKNKGVQADDITDVILTHLHFDHAGGATHLENGQAVPSFPNAKYYVQKDHLAWARNPTEKDRASFFMENWEPIVSSGMMEILDGNGEIYKGISVEQFNGHTKSLQMVKISDGSSTLIFPADLFPTSAHIPVPFIMGYDNYPLTAMNEKRTLLPKIVAENWVICYEHDAFIAASHVIETEKGYKIGEIVQL